jgi:hypothetical protein
MVSAAAMDSAMADPPVWDSAGDCGAVSGLSSRRARL